MNFLPKALSDWFDNRRLKKSTAIQNAAQRIRQRQEEALQHSLHNGPFGEVVRQEAARSKKAGPGNEFDFTRPPKAYETRTRAELEEEEPKKKNPFSGFDAKALVLVVSLAVNGYLYGVVSEKNKHVEEGRLLKDEVATLKAENQKMKREAVGKITVRADEVVVPAEKLRMTLEYVEVLKKQVEDLKIQLNPKGTPKSGQAKLSVPGPSANASSAPTVSQTPKAFSQMSALVASVSSDLPPDVSVHVSKQAGQTVVTYTDTSGYTRFFTAENPENAKKLTSAGLRNWIDRKYMDSLDLQIQKQASLMR